MTTWKELIIICAGGIKGTVDVSETDTLADVRKRIEDELDDDLLIPNFAFHVDGVRISIKQEHRKYAWQILNENKPVCIQAKNEKRKPEEDGNDMTTPHNKRTKCDVHLNEVTPFVSFRGNRRREMDDDSQGGRNNDSSVLGMNLNEPMVGSTSNDNNVCHTDNGRKEDLPIPSESQVNGDEGNSAPSKPPTLAPTLQSAETIVLSNDGPKEVNCVASISIGSTDCNSVEENNEITSHMSKASVTQTLHANITSEDAQEQPQAEQSVNDTNVCAMQGSSLTCPKKPSQGDSDVLKSPLEPLFETIHCSDEDGFDVFPDDDDNHTMVNEQADEQADEQIDVKRRETTPSIVAVPTTTTTKDKSEEKAKLMTSSNTTNENSDTYMKAIEKGRELLHRVNSILNDNPLFCSNERRNEWTKEIGDLLKETAPKTTIGVLGNTGVGKSSLLNALLDEASVLPTSGSRGCTAAVVELRYNADFENKKVNTSAEEVPCYRGEVEFITYQEWLAELRILVDECSTQDKNIYALEPDPQTSAEAANAWKKLDQVYGHGTMAGHRRKPTSAVFNLLANNWQVRKLLISQTECPDQHAVIHISEGSIIPGSNDSKQLMSSFQDMNARLRRRKKKWAQDFRKKINSYVYRKGNGSEPQTWPLIRKVVLHGPWACLSTGACLVDLPGVRDANAARAKVSEQYLQHCNQIWVVAPIKRAVDDGTAKELLGEQFKRRLLMDGQYGNVSFICTQTDDCEATEIMTDHSDVAKNTPGRWEQMTKLKDTIFNHENEISKLNQEEDELKEELEDAKQILKEIEEDSDDEASESRCNDLLEGARKKVDECSFQLSSWKSINLSKMDSMQAEIEIEQRKLKTLCALVRNEYSTKCLKSDFRAGLKELYKVSNDDGEFDENQSKASALPDDFDMDVYCISSNDYLKIQGIKPKSDGAPNTFTNSTDTEIPNLRKFVHETTSRHRSIYTKAFINNTSDIVDRVKLLAINGAKIPNGRLSLKCMEAFEKEVKKIGNKINPLTIEFASKMQREVKSSLQPALNSGAKKSMEAAMPIVNSWGSKNRRSTHFRNLENNGLYWATYQATVRRDGVFNSGSAGPIDMNQELCDPMEKEFSVDWQRTLDHALRKHLCEAERNVQVICHNVNMAVKSSLEDTGLDKRRLSAMSVTANHSCMNAVKGGTKSLISINFFFLIHF